MMFWVVRWIVHVIQMIQKYCIIGNRNYFVLLLSFVDNNMQYSFRFFRFII